MPKADFKFTTGLAPLPDVGELSYNGCTFSPLFETHISGDPVKDKADRTVIYMDYTLTADGYVTLQSGGTDIDESMTNLRELLTAQAGNLKYEGRGFSIDVNAGSRDVAWGPVPELLEFQPLGAGRSAKVRWKVKVKITEPSFTRLAGRENRLRPLLQFNYETSLVYSDDGYSSLSIVGTMEIPMTRSPDQKVRTLTSTVDNLRGEIQRRIMSGTDMSRFRWVRREFKVSRDKRTLEWNFLAEEIPYMKMPVYCTVARGTYSVRPMKVGMGLARWLCTLKATYTVRGPGDIPRRIAWLSFLALLRVRMAAAEAGGFDEKPGLTPLETARMAAGAVLNPRLAVVDMVLALRKKSISPTKGRANLIDFSIDEGLYLDSKTTAFSATWWITTSFTHILQASGVWRKAIEKNVNGEDLWAISMRDINGVNSWLINRLDPNLDVIVDFGGP